MLDWLSDSVDNAVDVFSGMLDGELPNKGQVSKLISDGITIAAIASAYGVAESVIEGVLSE